MLSRAGNLLTALTAFALGGIMAWNYPLGKFAAPILFLATSALAFYRPAWFLVIIPALLPVIGLAPWTGWITFEELDLLVLATASGGYTRALVVGPLAESRHNSRLLLGLSVLMALSILISMMRGFYDAGGFAFGWYQGYEGPMNSIRIGKSFFLALLLVPLMRRLQDNPANNISHKLPLGIALGLGTASLVAFWERLAFTDLLNFSSDYRSTALFWEMHVGGAALDGWLLLTFPFAIWALRNARSTLQFTLSLGLIGLAVYAALTTFSRGVFLALLISLPLLAWQTRTRVNLARESQEIPAWGFFRWALALILLGVMAALVFSAGGYRSLLALLGLVAVSVSMPLVLRGMPFALFLTGSTAGLLSGAFLIAIADFLPKGAYVLYAFLLAATFSSIYWKKVRNERSGAFACAASFFAVLLAAGNVADHWGGIEALRGMSGALGMLLVISLWGTFSRQALWPNDLRWQGSLITAAIAVCGVVAVFVGGDYMGERFSTSGKDLEGRKTHWSQTIGMLQTPWEQAFGKGLGRFPANYFFAIPTGAFPGTYQVNQDRENAWLSLVGPKHPLSFGDILRISQRLPLSSRGPFELDLKVRARSDVAIHVEVCEKQLLYPGGCAIGNLVVKGAPGTWQFAHIQLAGPLLSGGPWYAPRLKMFSMGIGTQSGTADIDDVRLTTFGGQNLLENSDFTHGMQRWFFSSDRDHMPWHAKNLLVNLMFDQGMVGLVFFCLLTAAALWRLNWGGARHHELAPYLTAATIGFLVVGMFDSLTDVPRLAFLYDLLILYALTQGALGRARRRGYSVV